MTFAQSREGQSSPLTGTIGRLGVFCGRNASDVITFHQVNGIHDQRWRAKVYRALGMHSLKAKQSTYYGAALALFENAKRCYERSGLQHEGAALVPDVRRAHHRKAASWASSRGSPPATARATRRRFSIERGTAGRCQRTQDGPGNGPTKHRPHFLIRSSSPSAHARATA